MTTARARITYPSLQPAKCWCLMVAGLLLPFLQYAYADDVLSSGDPLANKVLKFRDSTLTAPVPFGVGERIGFYVTFGFVPAGKASLAVVRVDTVHGQACLYAVSSARSAKAFDVIFKVRDSVETWFDADSVYAHRFRKRLQEGPYRDEKIVDFVLGDSLVRWSDDGREKPPLKVDPRIQDVLSAGYFARLLPMTVGDTFAIKTHDVNKTYDLLVIVHSREMVETQVGSYDCFKVEPVLRSGGIFKKEKGARVFVWVTADRRRVPVKMQSRVSFGTITAVLESYTPPYDDPFESE